MFQLKEKNIVKMKMTILHIWNICSKPQEKVNAERFSKTGSWSCVVQRRESEGGAGSEQTEQHWDTTGQAGFL